MSYIYPTNMCVACCFKSFGDSKCNTCSDLSLRYSFLSLRLRQLVTLSRFLSTYHRAFPCGVTSYSLAWSLILDRSTWESVVLGGAVSRWLTVLPSAIIFQPDFRRSSAFWTKLTDFAICIVVQTCAWWGLVGESPFGRITTVYLRDPMRPKFYYQRSNYRQNCLLDLLSDCVPNSIVWSLYHISNIWQAALSGPTCQQIGQDTGNRTQTTSSRNLCATTTLHPDGGRYWSRTSLYSMSPNCATDIPITHLLLTIPDFWKKASPLKIFLQRADFVGFTTVFRIWNESGPRPHRSF